MSLSKPISGYIYIVGSSYTDMSGKRKLGLTIYPIHRMRQYDTGDCPGEGLEKRYQALFLTRAKTKKELYAIEKMLHAHFSQKRLPRENNRISEWFRVEVQEVIHFLENRPEILRQISVEEINEIHEKSRRNPSKEEEQEIQEEKELDEEKYKILNETNKNEEYTETLYEKFCEVFLPGKVPRRIQVELWKCFSEITNQDIAVYYKGIVQWPTGCGKTIAILMMIVIAKEYCEKNNIIYRGLFVSPKNDIIDTISQHFNKLSEFGINVYDGSNAKLSKIIIPTNQHCLVMACHSALLSDNTGMRSLPPMNHIQYDEVHRITGKEYFNLLKEMMEKWGTNFLTGTSATPKTSSPEQHRKLAELFGDPYTILHKCDVNEAVKEGWIAKPRFIIRILEKNDDRASVIETFVDSAIETLSLKNKGGKNIFYIETSMEDVRYALEYARRKYNHVNFYAAIDNERSDDYFLKAEVNTLSHVLFACQRYREGSDIPGLEMTGKLVGNTTAAHNLIQISGRGLRIDYPEKEGWCLIARPSEPGTTAEDVLDSILLEVIDYLGKAEKNLDIKEVAELVKSYFGEMSVSGSRCSIQETIERVQAAYVRIQFAKKTPKERYSLIQSHNKELGIHSKNQYIESSTIHPRFIENPQSYFKDWWISWYDFLGVDTSTFPQTKSEWVRVCKERGITSWEQYKSLKAADLPLNPGEVYSDFRNWDLEFGIEEEIVW